jgi:hypothetical protein
MLVGHADAAMHLHAFLDASAALRPALALATRTISSALSGRRSSSCAALSDAAARDFDLAVEMRGAVLQRLELANQLPELLALLEIVEGHVGCAGPTPTNSAAAPALSGVERPRQRRPPAVDLSRPRRRIDLHIVK